MTKKILNIAIALAGALAVLVSCQREELVPGQGNSGVNAEGEIELRFTANIPDMMEVATRSVDKDGGGVQDMTLFCFNSYGLFVCTRTAKIVSYTDANKLAGTFTASVPSNTTIIHFVANQSMLGIEEEDFMNKSEQEVMNALAGTQGYMVYWGRSKDVQKLKAGEDNTSGENIELIRNHAMVTVSNDDTTQKHFVVTGMAVQNTQAFGTVAPFAPNMENGFDCYNDWPGNVDFVTIPDDDRKLTQVNDTRAVAAGQSAHEYIYEDENSIDNPVNVILKGYNVTDVKDGVAPAEKYYRVLLLNSDKTSADYGKPFKIRRNHNYIIQIAGPLSYGQESLPLAVKASATNNVYVSISQEVTRIQNTEWILDIKKAYHTVTLSTVKNEDGTVSNVLLDEAGKPIPEGTYTIPYSLKKVTGQTGVAETDKPGEDWISGNEVAGPGITNTYTPSTGEGKLLISLYSSMDDDVNMLDGTLTLTKGQLQRKITVTTIKEQTFTPSWISTHVYAKQDAEDKDKRAHVTLMYTVPESTPEHLFPMDVLISVDNLDVRTGAGDILPIIVKGETGYGTYEGNGYKFVHTIEKAGIQRVYFENILNHNVGGGDTQDLIVVEAPHFALMKKFYTYAEDKNNIFVTGLREYTGYDAEEHPDFPEDDKVYYVLVPQKIGYEVNIPILLRDGNNAALASMEKDEFIIYSQNLEIGKFDALSEERFLELDSSDPLNTGGRKFLYYPKNTKSTYTLNTFTRKAHSQEVVRISSNQIGEQSLVPGNAENYGGSDPENLNARSYRSFTFELANYNPFRFAAHMTGNGETNAGLGDYGENNATGYTEEPVTDVSWEYGVNAPVDIEIDVTSFIGSDGTDVDPFGTAFEIYIDAPMLNIDAARLAACNLNSTKLKAHPTIEGRFIYTVDQYRKDEVAFGYAPAVGGEKVEGERKKLPFIIRADKPVNAGDIVISSDKNTVVYCDKTFRTTNKALSGTLKLMDGETELTPPVAGSTVTLINADNGNRIGSVTVGANGAYEIHLRAEFNSVINWFTDTVRLTYKTDSAEYVADTTLPTLKGTASNPAVITLVKKTTATP